MALTAKLACMSLTESFVFQALPITYITQPGVARRPGMKKRT